MRRKNKSFYIFFIVIALIGITIGYAVINATLNINGKSTIQKNTWDVHFENVQIMDGSVTATVDPVISNNTSISNFEITLDKPGDFYAFTVDVVNDGSIDAMIDSVEKTPDLTTAQQKYLNYIIEYQNGEQITTKQLVKSNEFVRLKVRVEYKKDLTASDLPTTVDTLNLGFTVNYVQSDGTGSSVPGKSIIKIVSGDGTQTSDEVCIGEECFYVMYSDNTSVTMLAKMNITLEDEPKQSSSAGTTVFSSDTQKGINYSDYSGSIVEGYVNSYKAILEVEYDVDVVEARLITGNELGNSDTFACKPYRSCSSTYPWIYSSSYWIGTGYDRNVCVFDNSDNYFEVPFDRNYYGVRPVIVIPRSEVKVEEKQLIEFTIAGTTYQAEEGMTWGEWVDSEYNTDGYIRNLEDAIWLDDCEISIDYEPISDKDSIISNASYALVPHLGGGT